MPVEIVGVWKNYLGPRQDVILCKLGGQGKETGVAAGMSGSPVYFDGKLMGAISLRMGVFSPDAICGITPIESMLEIQEFDKSRPSDARTPDKGRPAGGRAECSRGEPGFRAADRYAHDVLRLQRERAETVRADVLANGRHGGAGRRVRGESFGEAGSGMGEIAQPGRSGQRHPGFGRYVGHRNGHGDLQRRQARAGLRASVLQPGSHRHAHGEERNPDGVRLHLPADQVRQRDRSGRRAEAGPLYRHHGRAGRGSADRSGPRARALAGRGRHGDRAEGSELQRVRASEVDAAADEHDAGEFPAADERVRGRDHLPDQRRRATGRQRETPRFDGADRNGRHGARCL